MKVKSSVKPAKILYIVTLDGKDYPTWAYNESGATSNAAFRYAEENDEDVKLVMWKINQGKISCEVSKT